MQHEMNVAAVPFEKICNGSKIIESRLFDEKRQAIRLGDEILFHQADDTTNVVKMKVVDLLRYSSFEQLFASHNPEIFGGTSVTELLREIKQFYSDEDEEKYGVVGIRLQKID